VNKPSLEMRWASLCGMLRGVSKGGHMQRAGLVKLLYAACYAAHSGITTSWTALPLTEIDQTQMGR